MKTLGLDIGTTSICAVVFEGETGVLAARTIKNDTFLESRPWERIQDPLKIQKAAISLVEELAAAFPDVSAIGVTGQMHGILYLNGVEQEEPYVKFKRARWNLKPRKVAEGHYYVIGDNRSMPMYQHKFGEIRQTRLEGALLL